jgi:hypothetical protein
VAKSMDGKKAARDADSIYAGQVKRSGSRWIRLDGLIAQLDQSTEINVKAIKFIRKGRRWLVAVTADVQGVPCIKFVDAPTMAGAAEQIDRCLDIDDWKADQFAKSH